MSAEARLEEAKRLAASRELQVFGEAQRRFVDGGAGEDRVASSAIALASEARRRGLSPETLLGAMELGGCYRAHHVDVSNVAAARRYHQTLTLILASFYTADA